MKRIFSYSFLLLVILIAGCKDDNPVTPPEGTTLFSSTFEINGIASYDGWDIVGSDSINVTFAHDAPSGGGIYSIALESVNTLPVQITKTVAAPVGQNVFILNVFSKYTGAGGSISFGIKNQQERNITSVTDPGWKQYVVEDTLEAVQGDSIIVILSGGNSELLPGRTYYDLVSLQIK